MSTATKIVIGLLLAGALTIILIRRKQASYSDAGVSTPSHTGATDAVGQLSVGSPLYNPPVVHNSPSTGFVPPARMTIAPSTGPAFQARSGRGAF